MATERYRVGDVLVDARTGAVTRQADRIELPPLSFALLVALLRHAPEVVRRQELLDEVWDGALVNDEALSQRVRLLREALGDDAGQPQYVASVRGWGYRIAATVERLGGDGGASTTVAVLPFSNLGGDPEDDPLCEGLAESIIDSLSRVVGATGDRPHLLVRRRSPGTGRLPGGATARGGEPARRQRPAFRPAGPCDGAAGQDLGRWPPVERAVRPRAPRRAGAGGRDRGSGRRGVCARASRRVYWRVGARPSTPPPIKRSWRAATTSPGEVRSRWHWAMACLERAIALDPSFAPAFDALAELYWYLGFFGGVAPRDAFAQSTWYALRALELDESLAETHALLGNAAQRARLQMAGGGPRARPSARS